MYLWCRDHKTFPQAKISLACNQGTLCIKVKHYKSSIATKSRDIWNRMWYRMKTWPVSNANTALLGTCVKVQGVVFEVKSCTSQPLGQHANGQSQQRVHHTRDGRGGSCSRGAGRKWKYAGRVKKTCKFVNFLSVIFTNVNTDLCGLDFETISEQENF